MGLPSARTALLAALVIGAPAGQGADIVRTATGDVTILPVGHGTVALVRDQQVILIDPARFVPGQPDVPGEDLQALARAYVAKHGGPPAPPSPGIEPDPELLITAVPVRSEQMARFRAVNPPSLILITHAHTDHLDPRAIAALSRPETRLIVPTSATGMLLDVQGAQTMANGDRRVIGGITIDAVAMYNTSPDLQLGAIFHPRGRGNGYVITIGETRLYVAGDTACTREMQALRNIDVAFVPMNLPYTMSPTEAAGCVQAFKPRVVYPYHYFESDLKVFEAALKGTGVEVRLRDWYAR